MLKVNDKMQSIIQIDRNLLLTLIVGIVFISFTFGLELGRNNPFYTVASDSMVPNLIKGDLLIINPDRSSFANLKIGDIIVFNSPDGGNETIVHRVVQIQTDYQGDRIIRTKGDHNPDSIPDIDSPIREKNYIGKIIYVIPKIGGFIQSIHDIFSQNIINFTQEFRVLISVVISLIAIALIISHSQQRKTNAKKNTA
jgi:signal peptidase I